MSLASRVASWSRWPRNVPGPLAPTRGASKPGVTFLRDALGPSARLAVEIAWGAPSSAPETWTWTDITRDVRQSGAARIRLRHGRADEAATTQPASCDLILTNRSGDYSLGGQSANYPNVRRNTPIRVRVDPGTGTFHTLFQGYATGFTPRWDITGTDAVVALTASGVLRRLAQRTSPLLSSMSRVLTDATTNVAYWPCEDGKAATSLASAITDGTPIVWSGTPTLASSTEFDCSAPLPVLNESSWTGTVPAYTSTGEYQVKFLAAFPESASPTDSIILRILTTGTARQWDLYYRTGSGALGTGLMGLSAYDTDGATILDTGGIAYGLDGNPARLSVELELSGSDTLYQMSMLRPFDSVGYYTAGTLASYTPGRIVQCIFNPDSALDGVTIGQVVVQTTRTDIFDVQDELAANRGELATTRLSRLCAENDLAVDITGTTDVTMGVQGVDDLLTLLRECETADQGILYDGVSAGLTYVCRSARENATTALTLDAAVGELDEEVAPVDDDQRATNRATATRRDGSFATVEDTDGPLGTEAIGVYDDSLTVNVDTDSRMKDYAGWLVHLGTTDGYRYPNAAINLARDPNLAAAWCAATLSGRVDITNVEDVRTQHPAGTLPLLIEGSTQEIDQFEWDVQLNTSPAEPWLVGVLAADSGSTGDTIEHLEGDGSTLAATASAGASSLSVATPSGPLWSTTADDYPVDVEVGGIRVTVTAVSGGSSPQTFTVTGSTVTKTLPAGSEVALWRPPVMGL